MTSKSQVKSQKRLKGDYLCLRSLITLSSPRHGIAALQPHGESTYVKHKNLTFAHAEGSFHLLGIIQGASFTIFFFDRAQYHSYSIEMICGVYIYVRVQFEQDLVQGL